MIIEQAGGIASTGLFEGKIQRVIDLMPDSIHAKCPISKSYALGVSTISQSDISLTFCCKLLVLATVMGGKRDVQIVYDKYKEAGVDVPAL